MQRVLRDDHGVDYEVTTMNMVREVMSDDESFHYLFPS